MKRYRVTVLKQIEYRSLVIEAKSKDEAIKKMQQIMEEVPDIDVPVHETIFSFDAYEETNN